MNRLPRLDFARSAADRRRRRFVALGVFGVLLGVELGWLAWQFQEIEGARSMLEDQQQRLTRRLKKSPEPVISKELNGRWLAAQNMVSSLSIPWEGLLSALEAAHGGKVIVESVRPEVAGRRVEIGARAADFSEIRAFIVRLSASPTLQQVVLLSETPAPDGKGAIRFVLTAVWAGEY